MQQTTNYNLKKIELTDSPPDITVMNSNWDTIDAELKDHETQINNLAAYAVASGTNTYTATISGYTLEEGKTVRIKFTNANTDASTLNINSLGAKAIVKGNGSALSSGNIKAGQIVNLAYTGSNFQLLGEGGEYGTATASDVLSGKTIGTEAGLVSGAMANQGAKTLTPGASSVAIPAGYHNGSGIVSAVSNLSAGNIKQGVNVGGVVGVVVPLPSFVPADMSCYIDGNAYIRTISFTVVSGATTCDDVLFCFYSDLGSVTITVSSTTPFLIKKNTNDSAEVATLTTSTSFTIGDMGEGGLILNPSRAIINISMNTYNSNRGYKSFVK